MTEKNDPKILQFKPKQEGVEFTKIVDGKPIRVVDIDAMTPAEREAYFSRNESK